MAVTGAEACEGLAYVDSAGAGGLVDDAVVEVLCALADALGAEAGAAYVAFAAGCGGGFAEVAEECGGAAFGGVEYESFHGCDSLLHAFALPLVDFEGDD